MMITTAHASGTKKLAIDRMKKLFQSHSLNEIQKTAATSIARDSRIINTFH